MTCMCRNVCTDAVLVHVQPPVIHRDLKSHNFLVDDSLQLRVCDFGQSKILEHSNGANTKLGTMVSQVLRGQADHTVY